ncbi:unnamed protein product [Gongylonema pulchrum]|uniref:Nif11 domain-containing protein n=1 Tax=Gongylonema pulchrum TaxID=637853 RepID=A0A183D405_9BILA|nr:unnamed protein product [Gongylonema pulchrum]
MLAANVLNLITKTIQRELLVNNENLSEYAHPSDEDSASEGYCISWHEILQLARSYGLLDASDIRRYERGEYELDELLTLYDRLFGNARSTRRSRYHNRSWGGQYVQGTRRRGSLYRRLRRTQSF